MNMSSIPCLLSAKPVVFGWGFVVAAVPGCSGVLPADFADAMTEVGASSVTLVAEDCVVELLQIRGTAERAVLQEIERVHCIDPASFL
ncbi:hypothetical protein ACLMJV_16985 [Sinorhizobium meliloti]|uniref:hypothetical protein n=1 Tax=Rhizobium meliloti TaxID=382 RepID=UPI00398D223E